MVEKKYRYIATEIWQQRWFKNLGQEARYLYLYLLACPMANLSGIYEIMSETVEFDTGLNNVDLIFGELEEAREVIRVEDWVIITRYPDNHKWFTSWSIAVRFLKEIGSLPMEIIELARGIGYHYSPIESDQAFEDEKRRVAELTARQRGNKSQQEDESPNKGKTGYKKFNEEVPF